MSLIPPKIELYPRTRLKELTIPELQDLDRRYSLMAGLFASEGNVASERTALRRRREVRAEVKRKLVEVEEEIPEEEPVPQFCHMLTMILKCATRGQNINIRKIEITLVAVKLNPFTEHDLEVLLKFLHDNIEITDFAPIFYYDDGYALRTQSERIKMSDLDTYTQQQLLLRPDNYIILEAYLFDHDYGKERYNWIG